MSGVYREKARVPPEPLYASLLSPFRRRRCAPAPDLHRGPTWAVPLWNQLEPDPGPPAPAPPRAGARALLGNCGTPLLACLGGLVLVLLVVGYQEYLPATPVAGARSPATPPDGVAESLWMLARIAAAEEIHRTEHGSYLGCSRCSGDECAPHAERVSPRFYPLDAPSARGWGWGEQNHPDAACWATLQVDVQGRVRNVYAVIAGQPGEAPPILPGLARQPHWPSVISEPWYVIEAIGDADGDGILSLAVITSFSPEILIENEGE